MKHPHDRAPRHPIRRRIAHRAAAVVALAALGADFAAAQTATLSVLPEQPQALRPVYARLGLPGCRTVSAVRGDDGLFRVDVVSTLCGVPPPGLFDQDVSLGELPQGSYRVRAFDAESPGNPPLTSEVAFTVAPPTPGDFADEFQPLINYSGVWWDPQRPGEGVFVEHAVPGQLLAIWNGATAAGDPDWWILQAAERDYATLSGTIYRASGNPPDVTLTPLATGSFRALDAGRAVLTVFSENLPPRAIELERFPY